jgi:hypothetical protein
MKLWIDADAVPHDVKRSARARIVCEDIAERVYGYVWQRSAGGDGLAA